MVHSVFNQLFMKILIQLHLLTLSQKSSLVSGNRPSEKILLLTRSHGRMCIRIYIFCGRLGEDFSGQPHFGKQELFFRPYCALLYCFRLPNSSYIKLDLNAASLNIIFHCCVKYNLFKIY